MAVKNMTLGDSSTTVNMSVNGKFEGNLDWSYVQNKPLVHHTVFASECTISQTSDYGVAPASASYRCTKIVTPEMTINDGDLVTLIWDTTTTVSSTRRNMYMQFGSNDTNKHWLLTYNSTDGSTYYARFGTAKTSTSLQTNTFAYSTKLYSYGVLTWQNYYSDSDYYIAYCTTSAATQAKTISMKYANTSFDGMLLPFVNYSANTYNGLITASVNSITYNIYIDGIISSSTNKTFPKGLIWAYLDTTNLKMYIKHDGTVPDEFRYSQNFANNYITPQMFGAKGNGTDDDTQAFQDALDYCRSKYYDLASSNTGYRVGSRNYCVPCLTVPSGKYLIKNSLYLGTATHIRGVGNAVLIGHNDMRSDTAGTGQKFLFIKDTRDKTTIPESRRPIDEPLLPMHIITVEDMGFLNFYGCFDIDNSLADSSFASGHNGVESSFYDFNRINAKGGEYFIRGLNLDSGILNLHNSMIETITHIYEGGCDKVNISNNWLRMGYFKSHYDGTIKITPSCTESVIELSFTDNLCVCNTPVLNPGYPGKDESGITGIHDYAWIDVETYAHVYVRRNHCGGELGGAAVVNWKAPFVAGDNASYRNVLVVEDSQIQSAPRADLDSTDTLTTNHCGIRLNTIPNVLSVRNNYGMNQTGYLIGVNEGYTSKDQLFDATNYPYPSDHLGGINWCVENNDFRTSSLVSLVHPYLYQFLNARYNQCENYRASAGFVSNNVTVSSGKYYIHIKKPMFDLSKQFVGKLTVAVSISSGSPCMNVLEYSLVWGTYNDYSAGTNSFKAQLTQLSKTLGSSRDAYSAYGTASIVESQTSNSEIVIQICCGTNGTTPVSRMYATVQSTLDFNQQNVI